MKHFNMKARDFIGIFIQKNLFIGYCRIVRPGSIHGV